MELNFSKHISQSIETKEHTGRIRACIINAYDPKDYETDQIIHELVKDGINIDWTADTEICEKDNIKNAGPYTYAISESNEQNKYSTGYRGCTGIIVAGKRKDGTDVSFMSHQTPRAMLVTQKDDFTKDLAEQIRELSSQVEKDSINAVVFGGNNVDEQIYKDSIQSLGNILKENLGFEPTVMTGPNVTPTDTDVFFDTQKRRLYIVRGGYATESKTNEDYVPSSLDEKSKDW